MFLLLQKVPALAAGPRVCCKSLNAGNWPRHCVFMLIYPSCLAKVIDILSISFWMILPCCHNAHNPHEHTKVVHQRPVIVIQVSIAVQGLRILSTFHGPNLRVGFLPWKISTGCWLTKPVATGRSWITLTCFSNLPKKDAVNESCYLAERRCFSISMADSQSSSWR